MNVDTVAAWVRKLESDLKIARDEMMASDPATDAVCFHCQQAVEKGLKAFLVSKGLEIRRTHDLTILLQLCLEDNPQLGELVGLGVDVLSRYAVDIRYPDDFYMPEIDETRKAIDLAEKAVAIIKRCLPGSIQATDARRNQA
jgi:HEPN domain-containing protein